MSTYLINEVKQQWNMSVLGWVTETPFSLDLIQIKEKAPLISRVDRYISEISYHKACVSSSMNVSCNLYVGIHM